VRNPEACRLLAISHETLYRLIRNGEIASYKDGNARKIEGAAIKAYVAKQIAASKKVRR
jgi:excisionase family DNA binding protein